jgi:methyl-accepting chemotaxis protein
MNIGKIASRPKYGFGLMMVLVVIISLLGLRSLIESNARFTNYVNGVDELGSIATEFQAAVSLRAIAARNLVLVTKEADFEAEKNLVSKSHDRVGELLVKLSANLEKTDEDSPKFRELIGRLNEIERQYGPVALKIVGLALGGQTEEAIQRMNDECRPLLTQLLATTNALFDEIDLRSHQLQDEAVAQYEWNRNILIGVVILALAISISACMVLAWGMKKMLGAQPDVLSRVAKRVAAGDLSPVDGATTSDAGSVLASLGEMQTGLANIVMQVRNVSDTIATSSSQIAAGNMDLSQRTEEQAGSIEKTAASMIELTDTVKNNADTARKVNELAGAASNVAVQGGDMVNTVVNTMEDISQSSRHVADIIGVIDGIAFQTNILALNAAVEAARAGEQGRGFAVVASEVRSLAQRSAQAAKEIKILIEESESRVHSGAEQVGLAGEKMRSIVKQVQEVSLLISEITEATTKQTTGIAMVNDAVNYLDQMTQQNASLVEESASAAEALRQQANMLTGVVGLFKVSRLA